MAEINGAKKIIFWILGIILIVAIPAMVNAMVANDRLRASEDNRIEATAYEQHEKIVDRMIAQDEKIIFKVDKLHSEWVSQFAEVIERLTRIEVKLEIMDEKKQLYLLLKAIFCGRYVPLYRTLMGCQ